MNIYIIILLITASFGLYILNELGVIPILIHGKRIRVNNEGVIIYSLFIRQIRFIKWNEISYGEEPFSPPFNLPELILMNDERISLEATSKKHLKHILNTMNIPYKKCKIEPYKK